MDIDDLAMVVFIYAHGAILEALVKMDNLRCRNGQFHSANYPYTELIVKHTDVAVGRHVSYSPYQDISADTNGTYSPHAEVAAVCHVTTGCPRASPGGMGAAFCD